MAELGSHQLDACSIFLGKKHPLAVTGIGGTFFYTDGREVDDHVFVNFEFPGHTDSEHDRVVVSYSSIVTNEFDKYGEELMGTRGTMFVEQEKEILLYKEIDRNTYCIRHGNESNSHETSDPALKPRCRGEVAMADAVIALTSNMAMRQKRRIEFDPKWFDWQAPDAPEGAGNQIARRG